MQEILIKDYINKLTEEDIIKYGQKKDIDISMDDAKILYVYAKNYWKEFYKGDPSDIIEELKQSLESNTFNKLFKLYTDLKNKYK